ncbi:glycoside hydrolase family 25 protein [Oryzifoliimicrobium ureilyticus]|uniref:glycoside hydrolase family 25 protein n=1 Tax=Oryzifoliimicrobium ureilyticus TaxID=3113724 RepID=UPI003F664E22
MGRSWIGNFLLQAAALLLAAPMQSLAAGPSLAWQDPSKALIIDAYELNIVDWTAMVTDKRIAGFISKASDGLPESFSCKGKFNGDTPAHCRTIWRKYAISRELYQTRRLLARSLGLLWGAYHLGRPGNPIEQANHYLDYADPRPDELMVLDIEGIDPDKFMSFEDAEIFVNHIKTRTGRYPILYTNHKTAKAISDAARQYPLLARLPLWYARYRPDPGGAFPSGNWDNYFLWQFSAGANCDKQKCLYRVPGTLPDIDVSVANVSREELARLWPQGDLLPPKDDLLLADREKDQPQTAPALCSLTDDTIKTASISALTPPVAAVNPPQPLPGSRDLMLQDVGR